MLDFEPRTTKPHGEIVTRRVIQRVGARRVTRVALICAAAVLLPASYAAHGQTVPAPTPSPAASTPSGQSADPRYDEQSRKGATEAGPGTSQTSDRHFMKDAAQGGMVEVELGQLVADKASSPEVKEFAQRMVKDHSQANDQLKQIASQKGVTLPTSLSTKDQAMKHKLSKLSRNAFDQAYMSDMGKDHKTDIAAFQKESASGKDLDVKQFASQTLPTLKDHLKQAESVSPKLISSTTGSK
jgi:putative membrane protein